MTQTTEKNDGKTLQIFCGGDVLVIPILPQNLGGEITFNNRVIPSSRLWHVINDALAEDRPADRALLIREAKRALLFSMETRPLLIYAETHINGEDMLSKHVARVHEPIRARPICLEYDILPAYVRNTPVTGDVLRELVDVAEGLNMKPVGAVDNRFFFHENPDQIYSTFKTTDWHRLGVYFKRPGEPVFTLE